MSDAPTPDTPNTGTLSSFDATRMIGRAEILAVYATKLDDRRQRP